MWLKSGIRGKSFVVWSITQHYILDKCGDGFARFRAARLGCYPALITWWASREFCRFIQLEFGRNSRELSHNQKCCFLYNFEFKLNLRTVTIRALPIKPCYCENFIHLKTWVFVQRNFNQLSSCFYLECPMLIVISVNIYWQITF